MRKFAIALLVGVVLATVPVPVAAQTHPVCQFGEASDSDGDGFGWEHGRTCIVDDTGDSSTSDSSTSNSAPSSPASDTATTRPGDPHASTRLYTMPDDEWLANHRDAMAPGGGCDYSAGGSNGGWGWNEGNRRSCPPAANVKSPSYDPTLDPDLQPFTINVIVSDSGVDLSWENATVEAETNADGWLVRRLDWRQWKPVSEPTYFDGMSCCQGLEPDRSYSYLIVPFKLNYGGQPTIFFGQDNRIGARTTPPGTRHPSFERVINEVVPDSSPDVRSWLTNQFWGIHYRFHDDVPISAGALTLFRDSLERAGFDTRLDNTSYFANPDRIRGDAGRLLGRLARAKSLRTLSDVVPGYPPQGGLDVGEYRERLGNTGLTRAQRRARFDANQAVLSAKLEALPNPPKRSGPVKEIRDLAASQARMILDVDEMRLLAVANQVANGSNPTSQRNVHYTECPGAEPRYPEYVGMRHYDEVFNTVWCTFETPTQFSILWNASSQAERLEYHGFNALEWEFALSYVQTWREMDRIADRLDDWLTPLLMIIGAIVISIGTGYAASAAYASAFGVSATGLGASVFSAGAANWASTFFLTGDATQAEKAFLSGVFSAGLRHYADIPTENLTHQQVVTIAILEGGIARLQGDDFEQALLASLATHYVPGLGDYLEGLDNVSPFTAGLAETLVGSLIENDFEWNGNVARDLENYARNAATGYVADFVGDQLPPEWGEVGTSIGVLTSMAVAGASEAELRQTLGTILGGQLGATVQQLTGNKTGFASELLQHLTTTLATAVIDLEPHERAAYIDRQMKSFLFTQAGEAAAGSLRSWIVGNNGGRTTGLIDFSVGLIDVAIANAWLDTDDRNAAIKRYLTTEAVLLFDGLTPGCLPGWADDMGAVVISTLGSGGSSDDVQTALQNFVTTTNQQGGFSDGGSCGQPTSDTGNDSADGTCQAGNGQQGYATGTSQANFRRTALAVETIDPGTTQQCRDARLFRLWVEGLTPGATAANAFTQATSGAYVNLVPKPEHDWAGFRLTLSATFTEFRAEVQAFNGTQWRGTGEWVRYSRNSDTNRMHDFIPDDPEIEDIIGDETPVTVSSWRVWRTVRGCATAVRTTVSDLLGAFITLWEARTDLRGYLAEQWNQFQAMVAAFEHNPAAFVAEYLSDLLQIDLLRDDPDEWLGNITCQMLMAFIPGVGFTRLAAVYSRFANPIVERDAFINNHERDPDSRPAIVNGCDNGSRARSFSAPSFSAQSFSAQSFSAQSFNASAGGCDIDAQSYFGARVDDRYYGPPEGAREFSISATRTPGNSTLYEVSGVVLQGHGDRQNFESRNYPTTAELGLPSDYRRAHLVGPGGFGQESGQILYTTRYFNHPGFMNEVEVKIRDGYAIAQREGWKIRFEIAAESYPNEIHSGAVLRHIDYEVWFEKPGTPGRFLYLQAAGGQSAPRNGQLGRTTNHDIRVYDDFSNPYDG